MLTVCTRYVTRDKPSVAYLWSVSGVFACDSGGRARSSPEAHHEPQVRGIVNFAHKKVVMLEGGALRAKMEYMRKER